MQRGLVKNKTFCTIKSMFQELSAPLPCNSFRDILNRFVAAVHNLLKNVTTDLQLKWSNEEEQGGCKFVSHFSFLSLLLLLLQQYPHFSAAQAPTDNFLVLCLVFVCARLNFTVK